jgi:hypothetical protein
MTASAEALSAGTRKRLGRWLAVEIAALACVIVVADQMMSAALQAVRPTDHRSFIDARLAPDAGQPPDILVLGDSHIADAFVPDIVGRASGLTSFNFGVYGSGPIEWEVLARDLLGRWSHAPRYAVIGASPAMFHRITSGGRYTPELVADPLLRIELLRHSGLRDDWLLLLSSYRQRDLIPALAGFVSGRPAPAPIRLIEGVDRGYLRNVRHMAADATFTGGAYRDRVNPDQVAAFRALLDLLAAHGIRTIIADPPMEPRHLRELRATRRYIEFDRTLGRAMAGYPLERINFRESGLAQALDYRDFLNAEHVCASGAAYFSTIAATWFSDRPSAADTIRPAALQARAGHSCRPAADGPGG